MGIFRMPSLGADMEAGTLVEWLKQPGDRVKRGDLIAVVETQKGAIEIEVFEPGTVAELLLPVGATVPVGTAMASIREDGAVAVAPAPDAAAMKEERPTAAATMPAPQLQVPPPPSQGIKASPAARKFAEEHDINLASVPGSGPDGAIVFVDVEAAWQRQGGAAATTAAARTGAKGDGAPVDGMRAAIAAAMARSKREIPHYYLGQTVDVTIAADWLAQRNADRKPEERAVFGALLLKAIGLSLKKYPEFNGSFADGRFAASAAIHLGMAIALRGGGLIAPAIHDAADLPLDQLMIRLRDLTNRVRAGRFRSSELADATITLTSLGERGVDWVQPIIYPPQVAIVGAGTPTVRPWIVDGVPVARQLCDLTLAADHRVSDGHRGALFLRAIEALLQNPEAL
ncbi:MAG: 2-oxo acid dehydrogenase subunit E2 [Rhodospirillaceae bacterium]|nr:2-oxo acid dehydrogenase subunit E2 [Rhodospirillaceae bacterium]